MLTFWRAEPSNVYFASFFWSVLLYTYNTYNFWTVCFLAIWYRKPDQPTDFFSDLVSLFFKTRLRQLPVLVAMLRKVSFKHGIRDVTWWRNVKKWKANANVPTFFSWLKTKTIYKIKLMSEKGYIINILFL